MDVFSLRPAISSAAARELPLPEADELCAFPTADQ